MARVKYRQEKVADRRSRVAGLLSQGVTIQEIARLVNCSVRTVTSDIAAVREQTTAAIRASTAESVGAEFLEAARTRLRQAWHLYARAATTLPPTEAARQQLATLREIRVAAERSIDVMQSLGLCYRAPTASAVALDVKVRSADLLARVPPTVLGEIGGMPTIAAIRMTLLSFLTEPEVESVLADMMPSTDVQPPARLPAATS